MHIQDTDVIIAVIPVLVTTVFFLILIVARIYATSMPINSALRIDPDSVGLDGLS